MLANATNTFVTNMIGVRVNAGQTATGTGRAVAQVPQIPAKVTTPPQGETTPAQSILPGLGPVDFRVTALKLPQTALNIRGSYSFYREMMADATLALAYAVICGPMFAAPWSAEARPGTPPAWIEAFKRQFLRHRDDLLDECCRAIVFGWRAFENIWKTEAPTQDLLDAVADAEQQAADENMANAKPTQGLVDAADSEGTADDEPTRGLPPMMWWIDRFKALKPEKTFVLADAAGHFLGVRQWGVDVLMQDRKAWVFTHDKEGDNWYGRSRLENCIRDYNRYQDADRHAERTSKKGAGVTPIVSHPPTPQAQQGQAAPRDFHAVAVDVAQALYDGEPVAVENIWATPDAVRTSPTTAGQSPWAFNVWNAGEVGGTLGQLQNRLAYLDARMFRGMLRPEREALAAQRGGIGTSDALEHGDIGTAESERLHKLVLKAINEGPGNDFLEANFGAEARDACWIKAADLRDDVRALFVELIKILLANPGTADYILADADIRAMMDTLGIPINPDVQDADADDVNQPTEPGGLDPAIVKVAKAMMQAMGSAKPGAKPGAIVKQGDKQPVAA
jgi:hypothetical protein